MAKTCGATTVAGKPCKAHPNETGFCQVHGGAKKCGAKGKQSGLPCERPAMANGRCMMHGGKSTGAPLGNKHTFKHGFYSNALLEGEQELYDQAEVGKLDDEIRLAKVKLFRYVKAEGNRDLQSLVDGELEIIQQREGEMRDVIHHEDLDADDRAEDLKKGRKRVGTDKLEIKVAAPNYGELIIKTLDLIRKLELARHNMLVNVPEDPDDADRDVVGFEAVPYDD